MQSRHSPITPTSRFTTLCQRALKVLAFAPLALFVVAYPARAQQQVQGDWQATVSFGGADHRVVLHITGDPGALHGSLDLPDDFDFNNAVESVTLEGLNLKFTFEGGGYEGTLSADGQTVDGTLHQGADTQHIVFHRKPSGGAPGLEAVAPALFALTHLPADEWKIHPGDVPHGESPDLDDSSWQTVKGNSEAPNEAVWYRRWIEVPKTLNGYDLTGAKIWFQFQAFANGPMPQIIYFNGRRVALGDDLEPIVLFDPAKPGDKILVAVKLLHTVDKKTFGAADLRIDFRASRPNPSDVVQEMGVVSKLIPALGANGASVSQALDAAAGDVDLAALKNADQAAFDASLQKAQSALDAIKPQLASTSVRLSGNSHIDAAWLWPWTETVEVVRKTFTTALQLMDEYPQYTYTQSAAAYSEWICDKYPDTCQEIKDRIKQGRWEIVGGMWVEPDLNMPGGESLVRQILVGQRYFKQEFGVVARIGWNPDSFGYNWQLPQIYKRSGLDYFVTQKMAWNDTTQLPMKIFWWESPDGSKVLTYFPHDYANGIDPARIASDVAQANKLNPGVTEMMHLFGVGDHGGGPTRDMLDNGVRWSNPKMVFPPTTWGIAQGFFTDIESKLDTADSPLWNYKTLAAGNTTLPAPPAGEIALPTWKDELYFEYHRGVFTTQANHKRGMRESEEEMLNAEKASSIAWLYGEPYPSARFTEGWKKVLFNQFHDLAAGSGIAVIYRDAQKDFDDVRWITEDATSASLHRISAQIDTRTAPGVPVLITNSMAWDRTDLVNITVQMPEAALQGVSVIDPKGRVLPMQILSQDKATNTFHLLVEAKDVPSFGYEVVHVVPGRRIFVTSLHATGTTLENAALRVVVDPKSGCITSLYDKRTKFESIASGGCGNMLVAFKDTPRDYDAWNIDADFEKIFTNLDTADAVTLVEHGPLRAVIRVTHTWQKSKFVQDITLYDGLDRVDVDNDIDWHETHILLKASFPLAASSDEATFEIPYGSIERPTTRNNKIEQAKFEVPALRWADLGDGQHGFSLINESKYGYDAKGNVLRISLLRSPTWPDPDADRGHHHFRYSVYPHAGDWKQAMTVRRGWEFNYPFGAHQLEAHTGKLPAAHSFVNVDNPNVVLTAVKKAEDADGLIFRFYEWAGTSGSVKLTVPAGATSATQTNLMEAPEGPKLDVTANQVTVPVKPFEIVTVRVDYPIDGMEHLSDTASAAGN
jgi:alpha-mannosidase